MTKTLTEQQIRKIIEKGTLKAAKVCEKKFYGKPKSLTEQWREGTLPLNHYYVKTKSGRYGINHTILSFDGDKPRTRLEYSDRTEEVLAPVPDFDEYKRLQEQLNETKEKLEIARACDESAHIRLYNERGETQKIKKQLNEANDVIKLYATGTTQIKAKKYEGAFYITDPFTNEQRRIEDWGEEYDADVPMSNDDKPANEYCKKWGVK